ncbi:MAG: helix-turn-helix transcriptional regulator [Microscillaceae bacterium]|nr:helix-turn-helix transcriptional regulator [Microscillaceae bacterium]
MSKNQMPDSNIILLFAHKIKQERLKRGLSQEEFAELTGFHRTYIGMIERGERNITLTNVEKFANALNLQMKTLFDFDATE